MSDYIKARLARLERNHEALIKLANDVLDIDQEIEVYFHYDDQFKSYVIFFKDENINSVSFHEVPYHWSGCGHKDHRGGENVSMPFTADDVLKTFHPVTDVHEKYNTFFRDKAHYLKSQRWNKRYYKPQ